MTSFMSFKVEKIDSERRNYNVRPLGCGSLVGSTTGFPCLAEGVLRVESGAVLCQEHAKSRQGEPWPPFHKQLRVTIFDDAGGLIGQQFGDTPDQIHERIDAMCSMDTLSALRLGREIERVWGAM